MEVDNVVMNVLVASEGECCFCELIGLVKCGDAAVVADVND